MFVSIYTTSRLKLLKRNLLVTGVLFTGGGAYAAVRELFLLYTFRPEWLVAATLIIVAGIVCVAFARDIIPLKDTYFLMNPSRLSYRLTLFGKEQVLQWIDVTEIRASDAKVVFVLRDEREIVMRLTTIPDPKLARHIQASISLAALEQNIKVNGVLTHQQGAVSGR